jgi:chorismate mutase
MTEQSERLANARAEIRLANARAEIAARVASFKAMQEKFQREREEYFVTTLENARSGSSGRRSWT